MNFEQFHLPGFLLRDLYKESLVELNEIQQSAVKKPELKDNALGNNQKQVLILVNYADSQVISDPELSFLLTILNACKLTLNDVVIVNFATEEKITYQKLVQEFKPKVVLLFGVKQASISMPVLFPDFQVQSFMDIRFLSSPPLQSLQQDDTIKRKLWTGLKQLFLS
jgi:DNA polymerase III psi subunit